MTMDTAVEAKCPKCGRDMWDNRTTKTNPKAPDFKCKDRACDGVIWPQKGGKAAPAPAASRTVKQPHSDGGLLPWEQQETDAPPVIVDLNAPAYTLRPEVVALYKQCVAAAQSIAAQNHIDKLGGDIAGAVAAMSATLFIQATKR